ncbi:stalk domain-containing protein [Anaerobacillus isosaccharinicus]|nr:stalk domain-containing protein [Anaerobacillus isosaccharinicus]QOY37163.1 copper amine oxidase N-terminal domain-containing protein [Anaerobacillus isosaccharinicus]
MFTFILVFLLLTLQGNTYVYAKDNNSGCNLFMTNLDKLHKNLANLEQAYLDIEEGLRLMETSTGRTSLAYVRGNFLYNSGISSKNSSLRNIDKSLDVISKGYYTCYNYSQYREVIDKVNSSVTHVFAMQKGNFENEISKLVENVISAVIPVDIVNPDYIESMTFPITIAQYLDSYFDSENSISKNYKKNIKSSLIEIPVQFVAYAAIYPLMRERYNHEESQEYAKAASEIFTSDPIMRKIFAYNLAQKLVRDEGIRYLHSITGFNTQESRTLATNTIKSVDVSYRSFQMMNTLASTSDFTTLNDEIQTLLGTDSYEIYQETLTKMTNSDNIKVYVDGKFLKLEEEPFVENSTTLVPFRPIFEALGAEVNWNDKDKSIIAKKDRTIIKMTVGSKFATVNSRTIELNAIPKVVNNTTYVPIRFIGETFGIHVEWEASTKTVFFRSN